MLFVKTVQAHIMSLISEALRNILYEANMEFNQQGITIKAANPSGSQFVHLFLNSEKFEKYECSKNVSLGIDMANFSKILKMATKQEILTMSISDNDTTNLHISLSNDTTKITKQFSMPLIDLDDNRKTIIPVYSKQDSFVVHIQTAKFKNICKALGNITEHVQITCINNELKFECSQESRGCPIKASQSINLEEDTAFCFVTNRCDSIFRGIYNLTTLTQFTKFSSLCSHVELTFQNDTPLCISYFCGPLGYIKLYLFQLTVV